MWLILWGSVIEHSFPVQGWLTFRQAFGLGGNVRKGEHGTTVVYADRFIPDDDRKRAQETGAGDPVPEALHRLQPGAV
jgi:antirestriction protein ArdC